LSVGLSRLLRANPEIRAIVPHLSIVTPATGGLPVAYGVCEAIARQTDLLGRTPARCRVAPFPQYLEAEGRRAGGSLWTISCAPVPS